MVKRQSNRVRARISKDIKYGEVSDRKKLECDPGGNPVWKPELLKNFACAGMNRQA